ncbi:MAG: ABC transporter permease [Parasporobacterium sp.]|nr:ABC transporter permease [Parasporobacterium sp.]
MKKRSSFWYCLGQGFAGIKRNKVFFAASVATIAACVFLVGLFSSVVMNLNHMIQEAEKTVCVTVFFEKSLSEKQIQDIGETFGEWPEVDHIHYTSAEEAWDNFKNVYFAEHPEVAEGFAGGNPLANSASYEVYMKDVSYQAEVVSRLEATDGVRQVNHSDITANALSDLGSIVGIVSIVLIAVLLAVSIFLISNTIITGIAVRKEEIRIMKYVGATDFFVKSPFIFEGVIIGLIGAIIPLIILYFIYNGAVQYIMMQLNVIAQTFTFLPVERIFIITAPLSIIIGAGIGLIGSFIATGRHIKV